MRKFSKTLAIAAAIVLAASPCFAKFGSSSYGGGFHSSGFSSSRSSYSSPSYSSSNRYSSPSYSSSNSYSSSSSNSTSKYGSAGYTFRPAVTDSRPIGSSTRSNVIVQHNYGGYGGGFMNNPFFWLWAMDNHNNQPVVVNGGGYGAPQGYAQAGYNGPSLLGTLISWLVFLGIIGGFGFVVYWIFFRKKTI